MNFLIQNGHVIDPARGIDSVIDIHIVDGIIQKIGTSIASPRGTQVMDMKGKVVAPGFVDMHVHLREPGYEHKETILTGCTSAAAGGFTAICCMPNTNPAIDEESVVRFIRERARVALNGVVDVFPIAAVTKGRKGEQLSPIAELSAAGAVAFSDDGDPVHNAEIMRRALEYAGMFGKPIIQHAQETSMTQGGVMNEGLTATNLGLPGMPSVAEDVMVTRDILLQKYTGGLYHVAHISTTGTTELVRRAKAEGQTVTCEVTPHHFTITDDVVRSFDTNTKMNPPLRTPGDVEAIKDGLRDGTIDVIATDHAPHSYDEKEVEFQVAPFGIVGLETAIGLSMTELVHKKVLTLFQLIEKFTTNPRRILHLPDVSVIEGSSANLTIFDPDAEWVVDPGKFRSKSRNSPFGGFRLKGKPVAIVNRREIFFS